MPNGKRELSFAPSKRPCKLSFWVSERVKHSLLSEARRISRSPPPPRAYPWEQVSHFFCSSKLLACIMKR